jgi:hypothetical protein
VGGQRHAPASLSPGNTHYIGGWMGPGSVRTGSENIAPTGIRSPDRSAHSESLYRLNYPAPIPYRKYLIFVGALACTTLHSKGSGTVITYGSAAAWWTNTGSISDRTKRVSYSSQRPEQSWAHLVSQVTGIWAH